MFTRSLGRAVHLQQRRLYATRNDIRFPARDFTEVRDDGHARTAAMRPHPFSEVSADNIIDSSSSSEDATPSSSSSPPPPPPPPPTGAPASSAPEAGDPNSGVDASGRDLTVIMSPTTVDPDNPNAELPPSRLLNPFDTHRVFQALEKEFPSPIAHTLMRATRGMLIDRISRAKREGVDVQESENVRLHLLKSSIG